MYSDVIKLSILTRHRFVWTTIWWLRTPCKISSVNGSSKRCDDQYLFLPIQKRSIATYIHGNHNTLEESYDTWRSISESYVSESLSICFRYYNLNRSYQDIGKTIISDSMLIIASSIELLKAFYKNDFGISWHWKEIKRACDLELMNYY